MSQIKYRSLTKKISQLAIAFALIGFVFVGSKLLAQERDFSQVEITTIPVAENVYMLKGEGGNLGLAVGDDGALLIDDQFSPLAEKIETAVAEVSPQPIKFLLNTHWHFDHTGGNAYFGEAGATIIAHQEVYNRLSTDQFIEAFQREIPASPSVALPKVTYDDTITFHLNGQTIQGFHPSAAHTDGDTIVYFPDVDVIHTGDLYFNQLYPFIDASSGGSIAGMIRAVDKILALAGDETKIIPGHGALSNRAELLTYRQMLADVETKTKSAIARGLTLEEFLASKPTAQYDEVWGNGFLSPENFLTIVYNSFV